MQIEQHNKDKQEASLEALFMLVQEFRHAENAAALGGLITKRLYDFVPYAAAIFWSENSVAGSPDIDLASDMFEMEDAARLVEYFNASDTPQEISLYELREELVDTMSDVEIAAPYGIYVPLAYRGKIYGGLVLLRQTAFSPPAQTMVAQCAEAAAYSLAAQDAGVHGAGAIRGSGAQWLFAAAFITLFIAGILAGKFLF